MKGLITVSIKALYVILLDTRNANFYYSYVRGVQESWPWELSYRRAKGKLFRAVDGSHSEDGSTGRQLQNRGVGGYELLEMNFHSSTSLWAFTWTICDIVRNLLV